MAARLVAGDLLQQAFQPQLNRADNSGQTHVGKDSQSGGGGEPPRHKGTKGKATILVSGS